VRTGAAKREGIAVVQPLSLQIYCAIQSMVALGSRAIADAKEMCAICTLGINIHAATGKVGVAVATAVALCAGG
jgi:hypothetical protein